MTDSFDYRTKDDLGDEDLLLGIATLRDIMDKLFTLDPSGDNADNYLATYEDTQNCYAAVLGEARRRRLPIVEWAGDLRYYTDLHGWLTHEG